MERITIVMLPQEVLTTQRSSAAVPTRRMRPRKALRVAREEESRVRLHFRPTPSHHRRRRRWRRRRQRVPLPTAKAAARASPSTPHARTRTALLPSCPTGRRMRRRGPTQAHAEGGRAQPLRASAPAKKPRALLLAVLVVLEEARRRCLCWHLTKTKMKKTTPRNKRR